MADYKSGGSCGAALKSAPAFARGSRFTGAAQGAGVPVTRQRREGAGLVGCLGVLGAHPGSEHGVVNPAQVWQRALPTRRTRGTGRWGRGLERSAPSRPLDRFRASRTRNVLEKDLVGDRGAEELKVRAGSYPSTADLRRLVSSFTDALFCHQKP